MGIIKDIILNEEDNQQAQQKPNKYEDALRKYNTNLDDAAVREAVLLAPSTNQSAPFSSRINPNTNKIMFI